jgi:hypothetical protein
VWGKYGVAASDEAVSEEASHDHDTSSPEYQGASSDVEIPSYQDLDWLVNRNRPQPADKTISLYEGVSPSEVKIYSDAGKTLKTLFYNIQQISYYCDFTMETAQQSFEKLQKFETSREILDKRRKMREHWQYLLKDQITPMRYTVKMWTRFNIAESAVIKMRDHFSQGWDDVLAQLNKLPTDLIYEQLGWEDHEARLQA